MKKIICLLILIISPIYVFAQIKKGEINKNSVNTEIDSIKINRLSNNNTYQFVKIGFKTGEEMYFNEMIFKQSKYLTPTSVTSSNTKYYLKEIEEVYISKRTRLLEGFVLNTLFGIIFMNSIKKGYERDYKPPEYGYDINDRWGVIVPGVTERRLSTEKQVGIVIGVTIIGSYIGSKVRGAWELIYIK